MIFVQLTCLKMVQVGCGEGGTAYNLAMSIVWGSVECGVQYTNKLVKLVRGSHRPVYFCPTIPHSGSLLPRHVALHPKYSPPSLLRDPPAQKLQPDQNPHIAFLEFARSPNRKGLFRLCGGGAQLDAHPSRCLDHRGTTSARSGVLPI